MAIELCPYAYPLVTMEMTPGEGNGVARTEENRHR